MSVRLMIVEDEAEVRETYRRLLQEHTSLQLVAETDNPEEAAELLRTIPVDAMILDLELSKGSGILLLEQMNHFMVVKPFIAVVTNVVSKVIYDAVRGLGVDYICAKGDPDFSLDVPLSIIEISAPYQRTREGAQSISESVNIRTRSSIYERNIEEELMRLGFAPKMIGTTFCEAAILYILMTDDSSVSVTKEIYPYVAEKHNTTKGNVERDIRLAIERVWTEQNSERLRELYPFDWNRDTGRPTNAEFLFNMAKKILRH